MSSEMDEMKTFNFKGRPFPAFSGPPCAACALLSLPPSVSQILICEAAARKTDDEDDDRGGGGGGRDAK